MSLREEQIKRMRIPDLELQPLVIHTRKMDVRSLARGYGLSENDIRKQHRDARTGAQWGRRWHADLHGYGIIEDLGGQDHDLVDPRPGNVERRICVRCYVNGRVTFQRSKFVGYRRHTRMSDLHRSIGRLAAYALIDLRQFPLVHFSEIPAWVIGEGVRAGLIGTGGLTVRRLELFLRANFDIQHMLVSTRISEFGAFSVYPHDNSELERRRALIEARAAARAGARDRPGRDGADGRDRDPVGRPAG